MLDTLLPSPDAEYPALYLVACKLVVCPPRFTASPNTLTARRQARRAVSQLYTTHGHIHRHRHRHRREKTQTQATTLTRKRMQVCTPLNKGGEERRKAGGNRDRGGAKGHPRTGTSHTMLPATPCSRHMHIPFYVTVHITYHVI